MDGKCLGNIQPMCSAPNGTEKNSKFNRKNWKINRKSIKISGFINETY